MYIHRIETPLTVPESGQRYDFCLTCSHCRQGVNVWAFIGPLTKFGPTRVNCPKCGYENLVEFTDVTIRANADTARHHPLSVTPGNEAAVFTYEYDLSGTQDDDDEPLTPLEEVLPPHRTQDASAVDQYAVRLPGELMGWTLRDFEAKDIGYLQAEAILVDANWKVFVAIDFSCAKEPKETRMGVYDVRVQKVENGFMLWVPRYYNIVRRFYQPPVDVSPVVAVVVVDDSPLVV